MVGEQLERDDCKHSLQSIDCAGNLDNKVGFFRQQVPESDVRYLCVGCRQIRCSHHLQTVLSPFASLCISFFHNQDWLSLTSSDLKNDGKYIS